MPLTTALARAPSFPVPQGAIANPDLTPAQAYVTLLSDLEFLLTTIRAAIEQSGTTVKTVATLPSATGITGVRYMVSDANATTFMSTVAGGGSNVVPVVSDGTNWKIG
jgi:hypothetical protein